ncbi:MAG: hypothetical protein NVS4B3_18400 [Gemmatimonadaceae bacterium]
MDDSGVLIFGSERADHLRIEVTRRLYAHSLDYWDGNWVKARVALRAGGFRAGVAANLRTTDFIEFRQQLETLYRTLRGEAQFTTLEDWLALRLSGDGAGHVAIRGELRDEPGTGNTLAFQLLGMDQTHLSPVIASLRRVEEMFPTLGAPDT